MQRDIQIVVKDRVARAVGQPVIVCGNGDYTVTFSFDDEWSEASAKTARFKYLTAEGMKHIDKELTDNVVQVPMLSNIREVEVGVYSADLVTSTGAPIRCKPSVRCGSGEEEEDILQPIIEATQEACRAELESSLETATGENYDGKSWDELNYIVANGFRGNMSEIDIDDIFEPFVETKDPYKIEVDPMYWKDNTTIDRVNGTFENSVYPTCVTPEMYVVSGEFYKVEGNCYETDVYQYDFDGNFVECSSVTSDGLFKVCENTATIRFVVPKFNDTGEEIDLNATIERFGEKFKLYYCDKYKLKDRVKLPDNIVIPTRTSELENDNEFITQYDVLSDKVEAELTTTIIEPNKYYSFGEVAELTIEFAEGVAEKVNEYMFGFVSGETATVLTLPSSVQWANEITVEPNKRYEISIVDNIALWCAVDLAVSE